MTLADVRVSDSLQEAYTLPAWLYTDPRVLEIEKKEIFAKTWQYVGHECQLQNPGDYFTTEVADKPIIVAKGMDGEIRAFYNVCTHRASRLVEGEGNKSLFTCPYHAWTFQLDGHVHRAPNMKGLATFDPKEFCLKPVRLAIQSSFLFVNLDANAKPITEIFAGMFEGLQQFGLDGLKRARVVETVCKANWKVSIDNYLECDHCPTVHKGFVKALEMDDYQSVIKENYSYQGAQLRSARGQKPMLGNGGYYYWLFPNMWISLSPGPANASIHQSIPIDAKTTKYIYTTFLLEETNSPEEQEMYNFIDVVRKEDLDVCELVQKGLDTGAYHRGKFSLTEDCVHHFHLLMQKALDGKLAL